MAGDGSLRGVLAEANWQRLPQPRDSGAARGLVRRRLPWKLSEVWGQRPRFPAAAAAREMPRSRPAERPGSQLPPKQGAGLLRTGQPGRNKGGGAGAQRGAHRCGARRTEDPGLLSVPRTESQAHRPRPLPWEPHKGLSSSHKLSNSRSPLRMLRGSLSLLKKMGRGGARLNSPQKGPTLPQVSRKRTVLHTVLQSSPWTGRNPFHESQHQIPPESSICHSVDLFPLFLWPQGEEERERRLVSF